MDYAFLYLIFLVLGILVPTLVNSDSVGRHFNKPKDPWRPLLDAFTEKAFARADEAQQDKLAFEMPLNAQQLMPERAMPRALRVLLHIGKLEMEVNNGGFLQYFTNTGGEYYDETLEGLSEIGATQTRRLLVDAAALLAQHGESPEHLDGKLKGAELYKITNDAEFYANDALLEAMHLLDMKFCGYPEPLSDLKWAFLKKHREAIWIDLNHRYANRRN